MCYEIEGRIIMYSVSVAIATYNGEKYIEEQLNSIMHQSRLPDEIILSDDASMDGTLRIAEKIFGTTSVEYKILEHSNNIGVVANFKEAIDACTSDIIFLCDQDDVWITTKIQSMVKVFENDKDIGLVLGNAIITDSKLNYTKKTIWDSIKFRPGQFANSDDLKTEMLKRNIFTGMSMAFKRNILFDCLVSENMLHDECIGWTAIRNSKIYFLKEITAMYRQHESNVVGDSRHKKYKSVKETVRNIKNSTNRYVLKYRDIQAYLGEDNSELTRAIEFYIWRKNICNKCCVKYLVEILINVNELNYKKYSSKSDHAILKDIFMAIFNS